MIKEEFKFVFSQVLPYILVIVIVPLVSFGFWQLSPTKNLEILVIDKTVSDLDYQEHSGLFWVLNHQKYLKKDRTHYQKDKDYLGFFPDGKSTFGQTKDLSKKTESEIKEIVSQTDLIYFADTYGVYEDDFRRKPKEELSQKIYGGMDVADLSLIREAKEQGKTIVTEYNSMASPTSKVIRTEFENLMGIKWTGWIGRYFDDFDTLENRDIPTWLITQYLKQHGGTWNLTGPGLIFIKETGEIEAFLYGQDYLNKIPLIRTPQINKHGFSLPELVPYPDWFDVILIERDFEVISYYDISPSNRGLEKLNAMGLPRFFPATIFRKRDKGAFYYFSGDFSDMRGALGSSRFAGLPFLWRGLYVVTNYENRQSFFWNYYLPLISQITKRTYSESP